VVTTGAIALVANGADAAEAVSSATARVPSTVAAVTTSADHDGPERGAERRARTCWPSGADRQERCVMRSWCGYHHGALAVTVA
jgi:hypothetical protein